MNIELNKFLTNQLLIMKNEINDLSESEKDKQHLQPDVVTLDLPEVKDIPGQENIRPPRMSVYADTTISSSDEEGDDLFDDDEENDDEENIDDSDDENVSAIEKDLLQKSADETPGDEENEDVRMMSLDSVDEDNESLNEESLLSDREGEDLDLPEEEETTEEETND